MEKNQSLVPDIGKQIRILTAGQPADENYVASRLECDENAIKEYQNIIKRYKRWEANIPAMVYLLKMHSDGSFEFIYVSAASKKLLNLEPSEIINDFHTFSDLIEPDDFSDFVTETIVSACTLSQFKYEVRFTINGETYWFEFTSFPEPQFDESIIWDGILLDITKRKKFEEKFSEERNLMFTLMENIPDTIYFKDLESRFIKVNKGYLKRFNLSSEKEILMKTDFDIFSFEHANEARNDERMIIETGNAIINKVEKETHPSGKIAWVSSTKIPLKDRKGNIIGTFGVSRDITEWVMMKDILAEERNLMSILIDTIPDSIFVKDLDGHFILNNSAHIQSLGVSSQEELKAKTEYDLIPYNIAKAREEDDELVIKSGEHLLNKEEKIFAGENQTGWQLTTKVPLRDQYNNITGIVGISHNISDFKNMQEKLKSSETRLRNINNAVSAVLYNISVSEGVLSLVWVGENIKQFGYETNEVLSSEWCTNSIFPDDLEYYNSNLSVLFTKKKSVIEYRIRHKDGHTIWLRDEMVLSNNSNGETADIFGSWLDITERMQAEEALLNSETQLANALKIAHLGHWAYDVVNDLFTFNDQFYSLFRTSAENEGGYTMSSSKYAERFIHPDDAALVGQEIHKAISSSDPNFNGHLEHRIYYSDNKLGYIAVHYFVVKDELGKTIKTYGVNQDITERKEAEETLRAKEYLLRQSQSVARIGSFKYNLKARMWESSETLDEIFGIDKYYPKDLNGWTKITNSMDLREINDSPQSNLNNHNRIEKEYKIIRQNDGQERWVLGLGNLELDENGKPVALIGTIQDITDRKLREEEKHELEKQLKLRNTELEKMISDLKHMQSTLIRTEKMASIGQLASGIAHEINNPLAYVSSSINRLNEYFDDTLRLVQKWQDIKTGLQDIIGIDAKFQEIDNLTNEIDFNFILQNYKRIITSVQEGAQRIKKIVEGMRGFAHSSDSVFADANINQAIDETLTIVWNEIKYKATVNKELSDLPNVSCNIGEIKQVLVNLLVNAAHSIIEQGTISISTFTEKGSVFIKIIDTGCGISENNLKRIFDPFFTTKKVGEGTGLGLWICSTIIEKHNGSLSVESSVGNGSTFIIRLPITHDLAEV